MARFTLELIIDSKQVKEFLQLPVRLYKNEPNWVRPLDNEIEVVFDPKKNKLLRKGEVARWLLRNSQNVVVGRVAAFINQEVVLKEEQPTGGMGFFECINDQEAAFMLFDQCKKWLQDRGMEAMDGPINFGDRDRWWGCLTQGFECFPNYGMPYNFSYYGEMFEAYGFRNYFNQYTYSRPVSMEGVSPILKEKADRLALNPEYSFGHIQLNNPEKLASDFRTVYNKGWAKHGGVPEMSEAHAKALVKELKPILDPKLVYFAYHNDEPIGFFVMIPQINEVIRHLNGNLNLWGKVKFFYYLKIKKVCRVSLGQIFGIIPEYQGKGVEGGLVLAFANTALQKGFRYTEMEMNWIGDFNPVMMRFMEQIGSKISKTHVTYRLLFNPDKEFKRAKAIGRSKKP
ncbi:hypothetical protein [Williamwhitmania taraxaci]|uniref:N-acetyltransferase domain-containing protein n=1 Tax=Williamwhitmania taraxaci TaxID=1640674 RepID=A0A1G6JWM9_9BACT|nr:hypothetical protein [Williamwhitmania taraxaci]SDC23031.1 hypothetical protein SAMN05216323_10223 [Williamwhitmania taraxaci]